MDTTFHWIAVGRISRAAEKAIRAAGGGVHVVSKEPSLMIIGLPCRRIPGGFIDLVMSGQKEILIKIPSHGLRFTWLSQVNIRDHISHVSVDQTELRLADEKRDELS